MTTPKPIARLIEAADTYDGTRSMLAFALLLIMGIMGVLAAVVAIAQVFIWWWPAGFVVVGGVLRTLYNIAVRRPG